MPGFLLRSIVLISLALILAVGWAGYDAWRFLHQPVGSGEFELLVKPGDTVAGIAGELKQRQLLDKPHWWKLYARYTGAARKIRSGEFVLDGSMNPIQLLAALQSNRGEKQHSFTIIEGWTIWQLREALAADPVIEATLGEADDAELMALLDMPGVHPEGQFLPDTYLFPRGTTDVEFLRRANQALRQALEAAWQSRQPDLPLANSYEALILASIVERETGLVEERDRVAGVMVNRLRKKMRLQTDPTVIYGIGPSFNGDITRKDLKTKTPYNTYVIKALPPTPIAMSGIGAIEAAVNPAETTSLFFVADGSGGHVFSDTVEQHNAAVRKYILNK